MRPLGLKSVAAEVASGASVTICSDSPCLVIQPFAVQLGIDRDFRIDKIGARVQDKESMNSVAGVPGEGRGKLMGDDRTGSVSGGEWLHINGKHWCGDHLHPWPA